MSVTATYQVIGMSCGHCVAAVTDELTELPGVTAVSVALVPDAASTVTVTSDSPLVDAEVSAAVDEAGYTLT
jgi:copper chaperone